MHNEILTFYSSLRQIFTVCPSCDEIHRLSDCKLYQRTKPPTDWKEKVDKKIEQLERLEERLQEKIQVAREIAREAGRKSARKLIRKIDPIFSPLKLNPNDAKVIFHPVDFIVFNGMNDTSIENSIKQIILLDKNNKQGEYQKVQSSIEKAVDTENYEWLTLRVENNGEIKEEE